jgi:phage shock protein PspC (stress-responsive transcriptional regulator)
MTDEAVPPPPPNSGNPPPAGDRMPPPAPPPWFGAAGGPTFTRDQLIRPRRGRYIAGVCGALGRATNTDPVLWRVLLAVLGFFGGVGVLLYLIGWLAIPGEGDSASPIESLLGRGRSGMKPLSVVLLGGAAVLTFAFVVNDGFRATLLAAAVLIGAALLLRRSHNATADDAAAPPPDPSASGFPPPVADPDPTASFATTAPAAAAPTAPPASDPPPAPAPAEEPVTAPLPPMPAPAAGADLPPAPPPAFAPPSGGYRPPFAPHGPYAGTAQQPYAAAPVRPPKPPKPPREKSALGRITLSALIMVMGLLAVLDLAGLSVAVSAYFAAALATIALGLIVGAWFGRSRGLIALALVATVGLAVSTGLERFGGQIGNNVIRPSSLAGVADRYDLPLGNATVDLRRVDFTDATQETTLHMRAGQLKVLLPPNVDATADVRMSDGRAMVFDREWNGQDLGAQELTNPGRDGPGGGTLKLIIEMTAGNLEVSR